MRLSRLAGVGRGPKSRTDAPTRGAVDGSSGHITGAAGDVALAVDERESAPTTWWGPILVAGAAALILGLRTGWTGGGWPAPALRSRPSARGSDRGSSGHGA